MAERPFGPYRLEQRIGRGGMGEVYRAFDTGRHRTVALKILRAELGDDEQFRERFRREAFVAARLQDPHIVPIHDFGEIDGTLFIDMRLVHGADAADVLSRRGPMPLPDAVAVLSQVAEALDAAHAEGVVHRDVKPSNILLTPSGFAYLVDFGIARAVLDSAAGLTATGATIGTTAYMAPELFEGSAVDGRADVYALACVFYELITGEPPFRGGSPLALMHAHLTVPPPRAAAVRPGIPPGLDDVIACGMAKHPHHRFPTAGRFAQAVRDTLRPVGEPPTGTHVTGSPRRRGWWAVVAVAAAAAVVATSVLVAGALARDGPGSAGPATTTATTTASPTTPPTTTPPPSTTPAPAGAADRELIAAVDPAILQGCQALDLPSFVVGVVASVDCTNPDEQPRTRTALIRFATRADLDASVLRETTIAASGAAGYDQDCVAAALIDVWDRGRVVCRPGETDTAQLRIIWTFDDALVIAYAQGDAAPFYEWWQRSRSLLR